MKTTKRRPSSREVANLLRDDILTGRLGIGRRLTEIELSKRFVVGRGRIREAIYQLTLQGLLVTKRNCGAVVAPEPPRSVRDLIIPIRRAVEAYALRLIFEDLEEADFVRWDAILSTMRDACLRRDFYAIAESDIAFHRSLVERAGQADLLVIWETLVGRIRSHFHRTQRRRGSPLEIYQEHRLLIDTFRVGNRATAIRLLKSKIE